MKKRKSQKETTKMSPSMMMETKKKQRSLFRLIGKYLKRKKRERNPTRKT